MVVVVVRVVVGVVVGVVVVVVMERAVVVTSAPVAGPMSSHYGKTETETAVFSGGGGGGDGPRKGTYLKGVLQGELPEPNRRWWWWLV